MSICDWCGDDIHACYGLIPFMLSSGQKGLECVDCHQYRYPEFMTEKKRMFVRPKRKEIEAGPKRKKSQE